MRRTSWERSFPFVTFPNVNVIKAPTKISFVKTLAPFTFLDEVGIRGSGTRSSQCESSASLSLE